MPPVLKSWRMIDMDEEEKIRLNFKEVFAVTIAVYRVMLPKVAAVFISICAVAFLMKMYFRL